MEIVKIAKPCFECEKCNYITNNRFDFKKHCQTIKHNQEIVNDFSIDMEKSQSKKYLCTKCNKCYKDNSGLWKHKKKCNNIKISNETDNNIMNLVLEVVKNNTELQKKNDELKNLILGQNDDFKTMLLDQNNKMIETVKEVCKNNNNIVNNTNINSHNKAFNLNLFLNETCKDAMDINEFEDSVKLQLSDLELVGKLGFVDGISSIIIKNLKALKVSERPIHCTDLKRESMYVKDQGIWEKQPDDNKKLRRLIKHIAFKNSKNLRLYKELHPDCTDYYSKYSDHYLKLQVEAFGGSGNETVDNENKIIKKIAKEMGIDKSL